MLVFCIKKDFILLLNVRILLIVCSYKEVVDFEMVDFFFIFLINLGNIDEVRKF